MKLSCNIKYKAIPTLLIFATVQLNTAASGSPLPSSYCSIAIDSVIGLVKLLNFWIILQNTTVTKMGKRHSQYKRAPLKAHSDKNCTALSTEHQLFLQMVICCMIWNRRYSWFQAFSLVMRGSAPPVACILLIKTHTHIPTSSRTIALHCSPSHPLLKSCQPHISAGSLPWL